MESWRQQPLVFLGFVLPAVLWLTLFFLIPLAMVWVLGFGERNGPVEIEITWTFDNYIKAIDPIYLSLFAKTVMIALAATVLCLIVSFPLALAISFAQPATKSLLLMLVILPFWTNHLIRTYALIAVLRTKGYMNYGLEYLWMGGKFIAAPLGLEGLFGERFQPLELLYSNSAVIFGVVYVYLPFMVLPLYASLERLDRSLLEASLDLGASQWRTFRSVTVPLAAPGIVSGVILVFIPALGTFLIPDLLGGPKSELIGNVIERQFKAANNLPLGSAMSFILLYLTFIALFVRARWSERDA